MGYLVYGIIFGIFISVICVSYLRLKKKAYTFKKRHGFNTIEEIGKEKTKSHAKANENNKANKNF